MLLKEHAFNANASHLLNFATKLRFDASFEKLSVNNTRWMRAKDTFSESFQMESILSMISMWRGSNLPITFTGHFSRASGMTV